jgi:hypothetical protein
MKVSLDIMPVSYLKSHSANASKFDLIALNEYTICK